MSRCSICHTLIGPSDEVRTCTDCDVPYHRTCWDTVGGCATYGCTQAAVAQKAPPTTGGHEWAEDKTCPACGTQLRASVLSCACGARFPWADPMTRAEYRAWLDEEAGRKRTRTTLMTLFVVSLFGVTAPFAGLFAGVLTRRRHADLVGPDGTYAALGYGTAIIGAIYTLLFVLLLAGR